jgi:hypothetical protein
MADRVAFLRGRQVLRVTRQYRPLAAVDQYLPPCLARAQQRHRIGVAEQVRRLAFPVVRRPKLSICGTNSCPDLRGIGSPEAARKIVSMVIEAPIPTPIAMTMSADNTVLRRKLPSARLK